MKQQHPASVERDSLVRVERDGVAALRSTRGPSTGFVHAP